MVAPLQVYLEYAWHIVERNRTLHCHHHSEHQRYGSADGSPGGFQHKSWRLHHDEVILAVAQEERDSPGSEGSSDVHLHPLVLHYVYPLALGLKQPIIGCFTHSISQHLHCRSGHKSLGLSGTVWCSTPQSADLGVRAPLCYTLLLCPQW